MNTITTSSVTWWSGGRALASRAGGAWFNPRPRHTKKTLNICMVPDTSFFRAQRYENSSGFSLISEICGFHLDYAVKSDYTGYSLNTSKSWNKSTSFAIELRRLVN